MAWTAPRTWATAEVVTAAMLNTHVRDNLKYLKGQGGAITLEDVVTISAASASIAVNATSGNPIYYLQAAGTNKYHFYYDVASTYFGLTESGVATRFVVKNGGNVGIGTTSPQGRLHVYNAIGGCMYWEYDGVDGTARTVIPDGVGDVISRVWVAYIVVPSSGSQTSSQITAATSTTTSINTGGGADNLNFIVNANGSVQVQRSAGTATFKVALWLLWI